MCIENTRYWQCCSTIDSKHVDRCPFANIGHKCDMVRRTHPNAGYCTDCRKLRNKPADDINTNPAYHRNDSYDRSRNPQKYTPVKSQPLRFPAVHGPLEPERGRTTSRMLSVDPVESVRVREYSFYYTERPPSSNVSDDRGKKLNRHHATTYPEPKQVTEVRGFDNFKSLDGIAYRVASPKTIKRLQRNGVLPSWDQLTQVQLSRLTR